MDLFDGPVRRWRARWVLPLDEPPIDGGFVETRDDTILAVGDGPGPGEGRDLGDVIVLPAPVNAHTHLDFSWAAGAVPRQSSFVPWVRAVLALQPPAPAAAARAAQEAAGTLAAQGVRLVGDHSRSLGALEALRAAGIGGSAWVELLGLPEQRAEALWEHAESLLAKAGLLHDPGAEPAESADRIPVIGAATPHGPHTLSRALIDRCADQPAASSIHLAESRDEVEILMSGRGAFRTLHEERGGWDGSFEIPECSPVTYLSGRHLLRPDLVAAHVVHLSAEDRELLAAAGVTAVLCPRSNAWTGAGTADLPALLDSGIVCALGTDSLASNEDLQMGAELAAARARWPSVAPAILLEMATAAGAWALGWRDPDTAPGRITPGRPAHLALVRIPPGAPAGADPYRIVCGDWGPVRFEALPEDRWD